MIKSPFVDYVKIYVRSGSGGAGAATFRREKHVPMGGPDGGDGGRGGSVWLEGDAQKWTLLDLKYRKFVHATDGERGSSKRCKGKDGQDVILKVPLGSEVYDADTGERLGEILEPGERLLIAEGGRGGLGNWHFRTATNQTPDYAQPGMPGKERAIIIELKVLADVGLVGFPNAGKSTLLAALTASKPKIADYPFTTLTPNLGVVEYRDFRSFVMADIPGIIEGASKGKGLGTQFLRHIERNAVLLFLVPVTADDPRREYEILLREVVAYNADLRHTPRVTALTKADLVTEQQAQAIKRQFLPQALIISAVTGYGLDELKDALWTHIEKEKSLSRHF
ncbi:MAG: GTPase ObgE, partial [Bacteroidia bacterium]|nr:GTPase ObgE [Bacteroidia bacterium]